MRTIKEIQAAIKAVREQAKLDIATLQAELVATREHAATEKANAKAAKEATKAQKAADRANAKRERELVKASKASQKVATAIAKQNRKALDVPTMDIGAAARALGNTTALFNACVNV